MLDPATNQDHERRLPVAGSIIVQAVSTAAIVIDLSTGQVVGQSAMATGPSQPSGIGRTEAVSTSGSGTVQAITPLNPQGYVGHYIDIFAEGVDLGVVGGPTNASVSGGNAPNLATAGAAGTAGVCMRIPSGTLSPYWVQPDARFLGVVATAVAATGIRIALSSR